MFQRQEITGLGGSAVATAGLIYHNTVRSVRKTHGNALMALIISISQSLIMVGVFYLMFTILPGLRGTAIRGDFLLYIMSGIFLFMTHIRAVGAVVGSEGPASPMMQHLPMNTAISIVSAALGSLYIQILSASVILYGYHVGWGAVEIDDPVGTFAMFILSWFTGVCVGLLFLSLKPWFPGLVGIITQLYQRANMIASGKMFVANTMPGYLLAMFDWNPLFHCIDQARGFIFINYNPHFSSITYPIIVGIVILMIGMMGEFYTRHHASLSWSARR
jgi:ABC-type polysaccharide/polyol phosphate export permease